MTEALRIASGIVFPECPRWHDGALWFSDVLGGRILRSEAPGETKLVLEGLEAGTKVRLRGSSDEAETPET